MIEELKQISSTTNPRGLIKKIRSRRDLVEFIERETVAYPTLSLIERIWILINDTSPPICKESRILVFKDFVSGYRKFCGSTRECVCRREAHSSVMIRQWNGRDAQQRSEIMANAQSLANTPDVQAKAKSTCMKKFGVDRPMKSQHIRRKSQQTYKSRTGFDTPLQNPTIQAAIQQKQIELYGAPMVSARNRLIELYPNNPFSDPVVREKIKSTLSARYNREFPRQIGMSDYQLRVLSNPAEFTELIKRKGILESALELGVSEATISRTAAKYNVTDLFSLNPRSTLETKIENLLESLGVKYIAGSKKIIPPKQLDFYLPDYSCAIEVGSLFWHSELTGGRGRNYHYDKWNACRAAGIELFQWFDDDILNKWAVVENKIRYLVGEIEPMVGARKTTLGPVPIELETRFLEENHIQGFSGDRSYVIGAYYDHELVSLMTYARRKNYLELTRFATKLGANYPGMFSRLMNHSLNDLGYTGKLVSFSNNCHSAGKVYAANGFTQDAILPAAYWYTDNYHQRYNRQLFMKNRIQKKFSLDHEYVEQHTEWDLMQQLGYDRIWDAGKIRWSKII